MTVSYHAQRRELKLQAASIRRWLSTFDPSHVDKKKVDLQRRLKELELELEALSIKKHLNGSTEEERQARYERREKAAKAKAEQEKEDLTTLRKQKIERLNSSWAKLKTVRLQRRESQKSDRGRFV